MSEEWMFELAMRAASALERLAAAEERRNQILEAEAAERRASWEQMRADQDAVLERLVPEFVPAASITDPRTGRGVATGGNIE